MNLEINVHLAIKSDFVLSDSTHAYSEPSQTSKMERFVKEIINFQPLTIFAKHTVIDVGRDLNTPL